jgi:hypothetical protein
MKVHVPFYTVQLNIQLSCDGGMDVKRVEKNNPIKMNAVRQESASGSLFIFFSSLLYQAQFIF